MHYNTLAPVNGLQGGAGLQGDSGGPFAYLSSQAVTVSNNYTGTIISGRIFSDYQFAVFAGGSDSGTNWTLPNYTPPGGTTSVKATLNGDDQYGVYIDQANYNWIESVIPEPSMAAIFAVGGSALVLYRRRRAS